MKITLIRHAPTLGNMLSQYIGSTDLPLCEDGITLLHTQVQCPTVKKVYTSGMLRCVQTAQYLYPNAAQCEAPELAEMHFGIFEGRNYEQMRNDEQYSQWLESQCEDTCPGGEKKSDFVVRCTEGFVQILKKEFAQEADELFFVLHGGTIMAILSALALPIKDYFSWKSKFCGGYETLFVKDADNRERFLRVVNTIEGFAAVKK